MASQGFQGGAFDLLRQKALAQRTGETNALFRDADVYRAALEKSEYGQLSRDLAGGYGQITNQLAGMGPLADSGVGNTLRAKLASQLYGAAQGRTQSGYAEYLKNLMAQRRQFNYQKQLQKQAEKAAKPSTFETLAGVAGGVAGFL